MHHNVQYATTSRGIWVHVRAIIRLDMIKSPCKQCILSVCHSFCHNYRLLYCHYNALWHTIPAFSSDLQCANVQGSEKDFDRIWSNLNVCDCCSWSSYRDPVLHQYTADSTALMMEINTASAGLFAMLEIQKTFLLGTVALKQPANICLVYHLLQI